MAAGEETTTTTTTDNAEEEEEQEQEDQEEERENWLVVFEMVEQVAVVSFFTHATKSLGSPKQLASRFAALQRAWAARNSRGSAMVGTAV